MKDPVFFFAGLVLVLAGVFSFGLIWGIKIGAKRARREVIGSIVRMSHARRQYGNRRPGIEPLRVPVPPLPPPPPSPTEQHWCGGCRGYHSKQPETESLPKVPKGPGPGSKV